MTVREINLTKGLHNTMKINNRSALLQFLKKVTFAFTSFPLFEMAFGIIGFAYLELPLWLEAVIKAICLPFVLLFLIARKLLGYKDIAGLGIQLTTRCTLRCKNCISLMPLYGKDTVPASDFSKESFLADMKKLLSVVDKVWSLNPGGGELLMCKDLPEILRAMTAEKKIGRIIIVSNGTLVPGPELLQILKHPKIIFKLSYYGEVSRKHEEIVQLCKKENIKVRFYSEQMEWFVRGEIKPRGRSPEELETFHSACLWKKCTTLMNGKIYPCTVYANAAYLGLMPENENELIQFGAITGKRDFAAAYSDVILKSKALSVCDYCAPFAEMVPAGVQLER
jgi:MoaA/NifB/PqqE/SkfB family radical SAM enzyme